MGPSKGWLVADRQKRGAEDVDGFAIYVCKSGVLGRAHRSHRWGHRFESCCDHQKTLENTQFSRVSLLLLRLKMSM